MKYTIKKEEFEALSDDLKKEYKLDGETATLVIEGEDAPTAEKVAKLEEKRKIEADHRKTAETKLREADDRAAKLQKDLEAAGGNKEAIAKLQADHKAEIEKLREEREQEAVKVREDRDGAMIREEAQKFANEKFTIPSLIVDQIAKRMTVEEVNGQPVVRVMNADGSPSTASLADLQKEFLDNKDFSTIIKATTGKGGGATTQPSGGATEKSLSEMTATEEAKFEKEHPEEYAALIKES